jgi:hypothetical protein
MEHRYTYPIVREIRPGAGRPAVVRTSRATPGPRSQRPLVPASLPRCPDRAA